MEAGRLSSIEIELKGSLAGSCGPGDTITCVGLVKVLKTESTVGGPVKTSQCCDQDLLHAADSVVPVMLLG